MKKLSFVLLVIVLLASTKFSPIFGQNEALSNLQKSIYIFEGSEKGKIVISVPDHTDTLALDITSIISMGSFSIEIYDPSGDNYGKFSITSQLNSSKLNQIKDLANKHVTMYSTESNIVFKSSESVFKRFGFTDEDVQGKISRSIIYPLKGNWEVRITSKDAKGSVIMDTNQKFFLSESLPKSTSVSGPMKRISGTVTDDANHPISGAMVTVKGVSIGAVTDSKGNFILSIPKDSETLIVSYKSFPIQEVLIGDQTKLVITVK